MKITKRKLPQRILSLPFISCLFLITIIFLFFKMLYDWLLYGGEIVRYEEKDEYVSINEMYFKLKDIINKNK